MKRLRSFVKNLQSTSSKVKLLLKPKKLMQTISTMKLLAINERSRESLALLSGGCCRLLVQMGNKESSQKNKALDGLGNEAADAGGVAEKKID